MTLEEVMEGREVIRRSREAGVVDSESLELAMHAFTVAPGKFSIGHPGIRIGCVNNSAAASLAVAEYDFSHVGEVLFERIG